MKSATADTILGTAVRMFSSRRAGANYIHAPHTCASGCPSPTHEHNCAMAQWFFWEEWVYDWTEIAAQCRSNFEFGCGIDHCGSYAERENVASAAESIHHRAGPQRAFHLRPERRT